MEALPEDYDRVPADQPTPEQIYHDARLGPDLQAALDSLREFRAAVVLCDIEGLSWGDRRRPPSRSSSARCAAGIHRGRQALRDHLAANGRTRTQPA